MGRVRRWVLASVLLIALGVGCSGPPGPPPAPGPTPPPATAGRTAAPSPTASPSGAAPDVVDALWRFRKLQVKPIDDSYTYSDGEYLITSDGWDDGRNITVTRVGSTTPILKHDATSGFRMEDVYVQQPWLIVKELPVDRSVATIKLFRYDLRGGAKRINLVKRGIPEPTEPEMEALAGHLYYLTGSSKTHKCVIDLNLTKLTTETVYCGDTGWVVGDPKPSADGLVVSEVRPGPDNRCKRLVVIPHAQEPRRDLAPPIRNCLQWSGQFVGATVAWDEIDPTEEEVDLDEAALYAKSGDGPTIDLGEIYAESMITCDGWFYWIVQGEEELRRWQLGSDIEVIFRSPAQDGAVLGRPVCGRNRLILPEHNTDPDSKKETRYVASVPNS